MVVMAVVVVVVAIVLAVVVGFTLLLADVSGVSVPILYILLSAAALSNTSCLVPLWPHPGYAGPWASAVE